MTTHFDETTDRRIQWVQVGGLALVQGAIALTWVIYNLYLVELLTRVGLSSALATTLLIIENLLAMVVEPLVGSLSDRLQQQIGTRFPLISAGMILAAGLFFGIPMMLFVGVNLTLSWVLPLMMVAWAFAMTLFRSPAMSLLGRYAFNTRLPQAASVLTLVGGVAGAMGPLASQQILAWGPAIAFALGSVVLLLAMVALQLTAPRNTFSSETEAGSPEISPTPVSGVSLVLVFGTGIGVTLSFRLLMSLFSRILESQVPNTNTGFVLGTIFIALAVTAIPAGRWAVRLGNRRAMVMGLAGLAFVCVAVVMVRHVGTAIALAAAFGAALSLVSNGTIPFALSMVSSQKAGLGTGMFFSGGAAASSLFGTVASSLSAMPISFVSLLGVLALLLAGGCITCAPYRPVSVPS